MVHYADPNLVRKLLGVEVEDAPDDLLETYLEFATKMTFKNIAVKIFNEDLTQDGEELNYYMTENPFIADTNYDKVVNKNDVTVYYWDDNNFKVSLNISSIDGSTGQIVLSSVPSGIIDVRIDYSYYIHQIDWDLVDFATAYYAAYIWAGRELYLVPPKYFLGTLRLNQVEPWINYKYMFDEIVRNLSMRPIDKVKYDKMVLLPRGSTLVTDEEKWWYQLTGLLG